MSKTPKKKKKWLLPVLLLLLAALLAFAVLKGKGKQKGTEVTLEKAALRTIEETVSASGKIYPEKEVKISSDVSGEIVQLMIAEGDSVVAGQLLAKIDPDTYMSAVDRSKASVNNAKANLAMSQAQIESSKAQIDQIKAQLLNAQTIHSRNEKLKQDGVISQAEYDQSLSNLQGLQANLRASEASLSSAQKSAEGASYGVKSAEASLKEMQTNLRRTTITSPTSGIVSSLSVEQGERVVGTIQMSGTEMMRIANLHTMEVQVDVSENDILRVSIGDRVEVEVDAYLDRKFDGVVTEIANSASNLTRTGSTDQVTNFIVKVRIDSESYKDLVAGKRTYPFRPGMSAAVDIYTESQSEVLSIPIQCVTVRERDKDKKKDKKNSKEEYDEVVFVAEADTVRMVKVKTGIQDDEYIMVTEGLSKDDVIVTGPYTAISKKLDEGDAIVEKKDRDDEKDESEE